MKITKWNGKPISKPGWYSGIDIARYHSAGMCDAPAVSSTDLRTCWGKSEAHMFMGWAENPNREPRNVTNAMLTGAVAHHLLLGEDSFGKKYIAFPPTYRDKQTAIEKKWTMGAGYCKDWAAKHIKLGRTPVKADDLQKIVAMARSLASVSLVQDGLLKGWVECSGFAKDQQTGLWLKVRPDVVPMSGPDFVDLKTAAEVTTPALMYAIRSYGYHQQGGLIWEVCEQLGQPFESFTLMCVETAPPFCARPVQIIDTFLALGRFQNRSALRRIKRGIDTGHWPGPGEGEDFKIGLSNDEVARIEKRLQYEGLL